MNFFSLFYFFFFLIILFTFIRTCMCVCVCCVVCRNRSALWVWTWVPSWTSCSNGVTVSWKRLSPYVRYARNCRSWRRVSSPVKVRSAKSRGTWSQLRWWLSILFSFLFPPKYFQFRIFFSIFYFNSFEFFNHTLQLLFKKNFFFIMMK